MLTATDIKRIVGVRAADLVRQEMIIGLGTGSTVLWLIRELEIRIKDGLRVSAVPTSKETASLAEKAGIIITGLDGIDRLELAIDGADEIDQQGVMIKGGGGALLQEKIVAHASDKLVIIVDGSKQVLQLGKFPLPVEVIPFGHRQVRESILQSGGCDKVELRERDGKTFITDQGHNILDCHYGRILDPVGLNRFLHDIPGVVETGLFIKMASSALIGRPDGSVDEISF